MLMIIGRVSPWACAEDLRAALLEATPIQSVDEYSSETLIIHKVATLTMGAFYMVVESDFLTAEDVEALDGLAGALRAPWRAKCVESDYFNAPHPDMPWSDSYSIHLVHQECPEIGRTKYPHDLVQMAKVTEFTKPGPWVRHKEDVPHEASLPDLYGLPQRREELAGY